MKNEKTILSAYGSHNASVSLYHNGKYEVVEVERWINSKNAGLTTYLPSKNPQIVFDEICSYLLDKCENHVDVYMYSHMNKVKPSFLYDEILQYDHHTAHAACAFYQTSYDESIVFTYDGGGDNGFFNVYHVSRDNGIKLLEKFNQDLGFAYMIIADYLDDIKKDPLNIGNLVYAGKLMGLCSYGEIRNEWVDAFHTFYEKFNYTGDSYLGGAEARFNALNDLMSVVGIDNFDVETTRISGQLSWDLAATTQHVFEQQFYKFTNKYLEKYNLPICLSGGCALNVLLNAKLLHQRDGRVFVPPNTSDCGISVGGLLWYQKPEDIVDLTYSGIPIMDSNMLGTYLNQGSFDVVSNATPQTIAKFINEGNIVGVLHGNSEHGPRALGNRSILCSPRDNMKDVINEKVKNREWYRPFAPVVRHFETNKYFIFPEHFESRHMTHVAVVRDEWKDVIPAVTHNDGTGRLQTVKKEQNDFLYEILSEYEKMSGCGVLLNTSFNVDKKPILSRLSDAFEMLNKTKLDAIYHDGKLISREGNIPAINQQIKEGLTTTFIFLPDPNQFTEQVNRLKKLISPNSIIIVDKTDLPKIKKYLLSDTKLYVINATKFYYKEKVKRLNDSIIDNTHFFKDYIKYIWVKDAVKQKTNILETQLIIDLSKVNNLPSFPKSSNIIIDDKQTIFGNINDVKKFFMMVEHEIVWHCDRMLEYNEQQLIKAAIETYSGEIERYKENG